MDSAVFQPKGIRPTGEQLDIQLAPEPLIIVEANAGAAKTTTLALRIGQALERGAPAGAILALTYSKSACSALDNAMRRIGIPAPARAKVRVMTFEELSAAALRKIEGGAVPLYETAEVLKPFVMTAIRRTLDNPDERYPDELVIPGSGDSVIEHFLEEFLYLKGTMLLFREAAERSLTPALAEEIGYDYALLKVFRSFEWERRGGHPDRPRFRSEGDATYDLARMLANDDFDSHDPGHPLAMAARVVLVDEMHDMNRSMFTVLHHLLLAQRRYAFVGVGDRDQVIHARAGADRRFMVETFGQEIGPPRSLKLTASYRFGPTLAKAAGLLAVKRYASQSERKTQVVVRKAANDLESARAIAESALSRDALEVRMPMSEFAVLIRHPHQSVAIENALLTHDVPYLTTGFESYLLRPEVLLIRALLACAYDDFSAIEEMDTRMRALRAMLLFSGGRIDIGDKTRDWSSVEEQLVLERDACAAIAENPRLLNVFLENQVQRTGDPECVKRILAGIKAAQDHQEGDALARMVEALEPQVLASKVMVQARLVREVEGNLAALLASAGAYAAPHDYFTALNQLELRQKTLRTRECVVLSSIEAAKGLEFEHVLIPNMNAREFAVAGDSGDERNLFYVAITRAKSKLSLFCDPVRASRYLVEAELLGIPDKDGRTLA